MKPIIMIFLLILSALAVLQVEVQPPSDDSYINMQEPATNYGSANSINISSVLWHAGMWWEVHTCKSLIKFTTLPQLPSGTVLGSCYLELHDSILSFWGGTPYVFCYQVEGDWDEDSVTWNNKPDIGDYLCGVPLQGMPPVVRFNITPAVHDWYEDPATNKGVELLFAGTKGGSMRDDGYSYALSCVSKEGTIAQSLKLVIMCCETDVQPSSLGNLKAFYH